MLRPGYLFSYIWDVELSYLFCERFFFFHLIFSATLFLLHFNPRLFPEVWLNNLTTVNSQLNIVLPSYYGFTLNILHNSHSKYMSKRDKITQTNSVRTIRLTKKWLDKKENEIQKEWKERKNTYPRHSHFESTIYLVQIFSFVFFLLFNFNSRFVIFFSCSLFFFLVSSQWMPMTKGKRVAICFITFNEYAKQSQQNISVPFVFVWAFF